MGSRTGHRVSRSFHVDPTPVAVLPMASPFSPATQYSSSSRHRPTSRGNSPSLISRVDKGFESREPMSPKVSCIGQIKLKHKWSKPPKHGGRAEKSSKDNSKLCKLKKLLFGRQQSNNKAEEEEETAAEDDKERCSIATYPSLGQLQRYTSGSYDAKFGDMFVGEEPIVAKSGLLMADPLPKAGPKEEGEGDSATVSIRKRRSIAAIKALDVNNETRAEGFKVRKPFTA